VKRSVRVITHVGLICWVISNVWGVKPEHESTVLMWIATGLIVIANPFVFMGLGYFGDHAFRCAWNVYILLVVLSWFLTPPIFAGVEWGQSAFMGVLLQWPPPHFVIYVGICLLGYGIGWIWHGKNKQAKLRDVPELCK
jgi:hypothetical protein